MYKEGAKILNDITDILEDFDSIFSNDDDYLKMKLKYFEGGNIQRKEYKEINKNKVVKTQKIKDNKTNKKTENKKPNLMGEEAKLYDIINKVGKVHIDDIIEETGMKTQAVTSILMQLEINGFIKQTAGKYYTIVI